MTAQISEQLLSLLSRTVESILGLDFPRDRWHDLTRAVTKCAPALGFDDPLSCVRWLLDFPLNEDRIEALAECLTIGETHFFRDRKLFQTLEERVFPDLLADRRRRGMKLTIWSAGCATGEEPYSIAMLLDKMLPDQGPWDLTILGTDVNRSFLRKAEEGLYGQWSFREVPPDIERTYFRKNGNLLEIAPSVKGMVEFSHLNLAKDVFPDYFANGAVIDVVFCRNVLMYFTPERQRRVIERFFRRLPEGGRLVVSPAEASCVEHPQFESVNLDGVLFFRKNSLRRAEPPTFQVPSDFPALRRPPEPEWKSDSQRSSLPAGPAPARSPAVSGRPDDGSRYLDGLALYEEGRYPEAVETLLESIRLNPSDPGEYVATMSVLARAYANQGLLTEALEWSEKAVEANRVNPIYHYVHASILQESDRIDEAVASLNRAVFLDPKLAVAHFALGNLARGQGRLQVSERHFRSALSALGKYTDDAPVPASGGLTAAKFTDLILSMTSKEVRHDNP